ncbi:ankyrin repeat domain-containing protein [Streptomyces bambusae]|uniref:ankyrin repeat domain-containing protein n=1 Tax=Streptomyces bambusae TaxID=1550616 RepID=UPI001CFF7FEC|nr:ankyrin repeat domain-containing protein [Streptomyces bambusae]MCB5169706.1 ankyrin repeat domain-containing protein [Streptomyces bambusae]
MTSPEHAPRAGRAGHADDPAPVRLLLTAARTGNAAAVRSALAAGAPTEVRDDELRTPLLLAALGDHVEAAEALIAAGADPDAQDAREDTPWLVTGVTGSVRMMRLLLPARPDLARRNRFGGISLIPAAERGHVEYVRAVLAETAIAVDHVNRLGWTALLEAVILGDGGDRHEEVVRLLLAAGADPRLPDGKGVTAYEHAVRRGFTGLAAILRTAEAATGRDATSQDATARDPR